MTQMNPQNRHPVRIEEYPIKSYDVDRQGKLNLRSLLHLFQEVAGNHASELGVGYDLLRSMGLFWVLSRIRIEIVSLPLWGETVTLSTWPRGTDRLFALRDFRVKNKRTETLISATTAWFLVKRESNRPQRVDVLPVDITQYQGESVFAGPLEKIEPVRDPGVSYELVVRDGDIDVNDHVNNAEYLRWIMDCFDFKDYGTRKIHSIQVNYLEGVRAGDAVVMRVGGREDLPNTSYVEGLNRRTNSPSFQSEIEWSE